MIKKIELDQKILSYFNDSVSIFQAQVSNNGFIDLNQFLQHASKISNSNGPQGHSSSFELANKESLVGFFKDIPELAWLLHKKRFQATQPNYDSSSKDFSAVTSSSLNLRALTR